MKTHKNPSLRQSSKVPEKAKPAATHAAPKAAPAKKPPLFELQGGKKWVVVRHFVMFCCSFYHIFELHFELALLICF